MDNFKQSIYNWNFNAVNMTDAKEEYYDFFIPIIQGYVGHVKKDDINFVLISRRSYILGGTRFNNRGIDNNGFVANFVETEQLMIIKGKIHSFKQIRGSLPFYWSQTGVKATIKIDQNSEINKNRFMLHIKYIQKHFQIKNFLFFNLLGVKRGDENLLTKYLKFLLEEVEDSFEGISYEHADFHAIT